MSRFNSSVAVAAATPDTTNVAGGRAFSMSPKLEFASRILTSMCSDTYYKTAAQGIADVAALTRAIDDPLFAAKAAVYTRKVGNLRSVSHIVAGELAKRVRGERWTRSFYDAVVRRPDDVTEILSYYQSVHGSKFPNALKDGLGRALGRFDAYQLAKYRGGGKTISLIDAVNICHPKSNEHLTALMKGTLAPAETWETRLSAAGKKETLQAKDAAKAEAWADLLRDGKLGYLACLRNLANIFKQAPEQLKLALALLADPVQAKRGGAFPFQVDTAAMQLIREMNGQTPRWIGEKLMAALEASLQNVPEFPGKTLIVVDESGSMTSEIAGGRTAHTIATLFAAALFKTQQDAEVMLFAERARYVRPNPLDSFGTIVKAFAQPGGGGTNFHSIFEEAHKAYDRIIILSDMQGWVERTYGSTVPKSFKAYCQKTKCKPYLYSFNLCAQDGTLQLPERKVFCLAGWSDAVFTTMGNLEKDPQALIHEIEAVTF